MSADAPPGWVGCLQKCADPEGHFESHKAYTRGNALIVPQFCPRCGGKIKRKPVLKEANNGRVHE